MHRTEAVPVEVEDLDDRREDGRATDDRPEAELLFERRVVVVGPEERMREHLGDGGNDGRDRAGDGGADDGAALDLA